MEPRAGSDLLHAPVLQHRKLRNEVRPLDYGAGAQSEGDAGDGKSGGVQAGEGTQGSGMAPGMTIDLRAFLESKRASDPALLVRRPNRVG